MTDQIDEKFMHTGTGGQQRRQPTTTETLDAVVCQVQADDMRSLQNVKSGFQEQSTDTAPAVQRPVLGVQAWSWRLISSLWVLSGSCGLMSQRDC